LISNDEVDPVRKPGLARWKVNSTEKGLRLPLNRDIDAAEELEADKVLATGSIREREPCREGNAHGEEAVKHSGQSKQGFEIWMIRWIVPGEDARIRQDLPSFASLTYDHGAHMPLLPNRDKPNGAVWRDVLQIAS
jgi:hypothetical protein